MPIKIEQPTVLYTVKEVSDMLNCTPVNIHKHICNGSLKCYIMYSSNNKVKGRLVSTEHIEAFQNRVIVHSKKKWARRKIQVIPKALAKYLTFEDIKQIKKYVTDNYDSSTSPLTERQHTVIVKRIYNLLSLQTIADEIGVTRETIAKDYRKGLTKLIIHKHKDLWQKSPTITPWQKISTWVKNTNPLIRKG